MAFGAGIHAGGSGTSWSTYTQTYSTADATHAARLAQAITDNSGGTPSTTVADITDGVNVGSCDRVPVENAIASILAQLENLRADQLDTAQVVNRIIDDTQA